MIYIIGLGSTDENGLTLEAYKQIKAGKKNFLRTQMHAAVKIFQDEDIAYKSFDYLYEEEASFEKVYDKIVDILLEEAREADINYCVPGDPFIAEKTVIKLIERTKNYKIISGMSFIEAILKAVKIDPSKGFQLLDGDDFDPNQLDTRSDIVITQVYNRRVSVDLKLALSEIYSDEYEIYLITDAGLASESVYHIPIYKLDRLENINHQTAIFIPKAKDMLSIGRLISKLEESCDMGDDYFLEQEDFNKLLDNISEELSKLVKLNCKGYYSYKEMLNYLYENIGKNQ